MVADILFHDQVLYDRATVPQASIRMDLTFALVLARFVFDFYIFVLHRFIELTYGKFGDVLNELL